MPRKARPKPTIIADTREKIPWDFSAYTDFAGSISRKLDAGDYSLVGMEHLLSIERKATADELYVNFFSAQSRDRMYREMERLQKIKYRFIIIEQDLETIANPTSYYVNNRNKNRFSISVPPTIVLRELVKLMLQYNVHVIFAGNKARSIAKRIMLQVYQKHYGDSTDSTEIPQAEDS